MFGTHRIKNYVMDMQQGILGFQCIYRYVGGNVENTGMSIYGDIMESVDSYG